MRDQDFPVELFALRPAHPALAPLVLLGGMGPLAGAKGFVRACSMFGESREIVLLQACSIPDRTQAALADARSQTGSSPEHVAVGCALEAALDEAVRHVTSTRRPIDVIVLCNAAHAFFSLPVARDPLPASQSTGHGSQSTGHGSRATNVRLISLVECVVGALGRHPSGPALILSSLGTRVSRIFPRRLEQAGIAYVEPSDRIQDVLMRAIYEGLKALDWETASAAGEAVFTELLGAGTDIGCIVAACTEIPQIVELVKRTGSEDLRARLSRIDVVDPVELALHAVARAAA